MGFSSAAALVRVIHWQVSGVKPFASIFIVHPHVSETLTLMPTRSPAWHTNLRKGRRRARLGLRHPGLWTPRTLRITTEARIPRVSRNFSGWTCPRCHVHCGDWRRKCELAIAKETLRCFRLCLKFRCSMSLCLSGSRVCAIDFHQQSAASLHPKTSLAATLTTVHFRREKQIGRPGSRTMATPPSAPCVSTRTTICGTCWRRHGRASAMERVLASTPLETGGCSRRKVGLLRVHPATVAHRGALSSQNVTGPPSACQPQRRPAVTGRGSTWRTGKHRTAVDTRAVVYRSSRRASSAPTPLITS